MTDYSQLRKGDTVRFTIEGVVHSQNSRGPSGSVCRTVRFSVLDDSADVTLSWEETISPEFEVLRTTLSSGDVAEIRVPSTQEIRRALYVVPRNGIGYWMDARGTTWNNIKHGDIVRFIDRVNP